MISPLLNRLTRARKARSAAVVRSVAGLPVGTANRRGTVLVLVIGALALISVITLVYATIGQSDRRQAAVNQTHADVQAVVSQSADYIAQKIGDGALATMVSGTYTKAGAGTVLPVLVRQAADYPSTDPARLSVFPTTLPANSPLRDMHFDPDGSYDTRWTLNGVDPRIPSTPFLSSTQPASLSDATPNLMLGRDWLHISNVAPDGRAVNLSNLAPMLNGKRFSSFRATSAPPVTATGAAVLAPNAPVMQPNPGNGSTTPPRSYLSFGLSLYDKTGVPTMNLDFGDPADVNHPAHWDSRQQWMFRPASGPVFFSTTVSDPAGMDANSPGSMWYPPYQYCDADGDGLFDSRWIELVDASDPNNPVSFLPKDDRFRWFIATRVMDLSALVNVNTATTFDAQGTAPATLVTLFGATPADVDLRRLLTMDDLYRRYGSAPNIGPFGYAGLEQPVLASQPDNYSGYDRVTAALVGDRGYRALHAALLSSSEAVIDPLTSVGNQVNLWRDDRFSLYAGTGGQAEAGYSLNGAIPTFTGSARFSAADLKELLTYWATNNANSTSRLKATVDGRSNSANGGNTPGFGPLRSNRPDTLERRGIDNAENNGQGNGQADHDAMIKSVFDVRHYITPVSWSRPLRSAVVPPADATTGLSWKNELGSPVDQKVDAISALAAATDVAYAKQDPSQVFKGYAQALLPYAWVRSGGVPPASVWDPASRFATLSFGHNAELALRTAAHMTANLIDSYDKKSDPHAYTLLIDDSKRNSLDNLKFPWWSEIGNTAVTPNTFPGRLDFGTANLAHTASGSPPLDPATTASLGAVNIYGIEAQPFLTMVTSFMVYTDAPQAAGGDDEFGDGREHITIDGSAGSADNLGQIIAFQITNPFDVNIGLTDTTNLDPTTAIADDRYSDFYIQFGGSLAAGGNVYKLINYREPAHDFVPIVLHKGETRVFYCLSDSLQTMEQKWAHSAGLHPLTANPVTKVVESQLGIIATPGVTYTAAETMTDGRIKPIEIRQMNQASGVTQNVTGNNMFSATAADNLHVLLWRTLHSAGDAAPNNKRSNDMLVDHLRDPSPSSTLDRRLPTTNQEIGGTTSAPDDFTPDNTGYSIVMWGSIKRRNDPGIAGATPLGGIPAYCLEAKFGTTLKNFKALVSAAPGSLSKGDFVGGAPGRNNADDTLKKLVAKLAAVGTGSGSASGSPSLLVPDMTRRPKDWATGGTIPGNEDVPSKQYNTGYPVLHLDDKQYQAELTPGMPTTTISTLRLADLLLPMGIGPMCDPGIGAGTLDPDAWMTLSEALALGLNYGSPATGAPGWGLYAKIGDSQLGVLDRGNLALDRGAPFEDADLNHTFEGRGSPTQGNDEMRWPGIPLALNVLNVFTVSDPQFGGLKQATQGLININTAPWAVLCTIPFLAPTTEPGVWAAWKTAYGVTSPDMVPEPPTSPTPDPTDMTGTDVASGILAYRERQLTDSSNATLPFEDRDRHLIRFTDTVSGGSPFNTLLRDGRFQTTKIPAHRETAGFATPGEVLTIVDRTGAGNTPGTTRIVARGDQIDGPANDTVASGMIGMNTTLFKDSTGTVKVDGVPDDYAEKLAIAQAALGSVTVRSDVFAVWFVVQGYQKSDTEGLGPSDLLKPSIAKRYLMVVDRSNVTRKGEKPRILFLTEVPM